MSFNVGTVLTSGLAVALCSAIVSGFIGWQAASMKIEQEFEYRQAESGYEALVQGNVSRWQEKEIQSVAAEAKNPALLSEAYKSRLESKRSYAIARNKIGVFGSPEVVVALSNYYSKHGMAMYPCEDNEKAKADIKIYQAIRKTLGIGTLVSDVELGHVMLLCSLK